MQFRRIVTGLDTDGRSVLARSDELPRSEAGDVAINIFRAWGTDTLPIILPTDGRTPPIDGADRAADLDAFIRDLHPEGPEHGLRIGIYAWQPHTGTKDKVGLHWHDTVDVFFMITGELVLYSEDGSITIRPGDVVIVNGTNHVFDNESDAPAVFGLVSLGGRREGASPPRANKLDWSAERGYFFGKEPVSARSDQMER
jgi:uncharacterized cupin superfamily protein